MLFAADVADRATLFRITVGEAGGRKGHIIGGLSRAATLVHAIVVGSHAGVPTVVEVGVDPSTNQKLGFVKEALDEKGSRLEELTKTLAYVRENPGSMEFIRVGIFYFG